MSAATVSRLDDDDVALLESAYWQQVFADATHAVVMGLGR